MKKIILFNIFLILYANFCLSFFDWEAFKTEKFILFYKNRYEKRALKLLSKIEYFSSIPEKIVDNRVSYLPLVLEDYGNYSNGFANPVYYNIHIINNESGDADWFTLAGIHEYTHILHLTKANGIPGFLTNVIGNILSPQIFSPLWIYEGITVYCESGINKFMGRLNDGGYDSYITATNLDNKFPSILKATYIPLEAPFGNTPYLFGSKFFNFLSEKYGEEKLKEFYNSYGSSLLSYFSPLFPWLGIDRTFLEVYGKSTEDLWQLWKMDEIEKNLNYEQQGDKITDFNSYVSYPIIHDDKLYFTKINFIKNGAYSVRVKQDIMVMDIEKQEINLLFSTLTNINHPLRLLNNKMYYSVDEIKPGFDNRSNYSYGIISIIIERDIKTQEEKEILSDEIKTFDFLYGKLIYAKEKKNDSGSELFEYDLETKENKLLLDSEYYIFLLKSYNEKLYCVAKKDGENKGIYKIDLKNKKLEIIIDTPYIEDEISIVDDKIFFQSNYEKIYSLYCYDIRNKKIFRLTDNGIAGSPAYDNKRKELYFIGLHSQGFDLYKLKPEFKEFNFKKEKQSKVIVPDINKEKVTKGGYVDNILTLFPKIRIPLVYMDSKKHFNAGFLINGMDAIGDFNYSLTFLYDFEKSITYQDLMFNSYIFGPLIMNLSYSNFNNKRSDMVGLGMDYILYRSYKPGISYISAGIANYFYDNFTKQRIIPGINTVISYPSFDINFTYKIIFENEKLILNENSKEGYYGRLIFSYFLPETKITFSSDGFYGLNENIDNEMEIRGYKGKITGEKGIFFTNEISRNLFKIRNGLWNPINFYFEDLSGVLFFDYAMNEKENYYTGGVELHSELKLLFFVNLDFGIFFAVNKDYEGSYGILLKSPQINF